MKQTTARSVSELKNCEKTGKENTGIKSYAMKHISIPEHILKDLVIHAQRGYPHEVCGILAGTDFLSCRICEMTNIEKSPVSYLMDPAEQFRVFRDIRDRGEKMLAIYHSHPVSEAFPSAKDVSLAFYSEPLYIIISLMGESPVIKAYSINEEKVEEIFLKPL
jgi:proteasome lid subunit RPN8/RPN11